MTTTTRAKRVIGVRSRNTDAISYFDPGDLEFSVGDKVVVDITVEPDLGTVVLAPDAITHRDQVLPILPALRHATAEDTDKREECFLREVKALLLAKAKARILGMSIKFSCPRFGLDGRKLALDFSSVERLDFRELYRRLKCCIRFEYEQYRAVNKVLPKVEQRVVIAEGSARVIVGHPLKETVSVVLEQRGPDDFLRTAEFAMRCRAHGAGRRPGS